MILETERLRLRRLTLLDAPFMLGLLNEPAWHRFIGDRGVRTVEEAREYLGKSYLRGYERDGFSMFLVERKRDAAPLGVCGLMQRDTLDDVDLGFGFKSDYRRRGYAYEASVGTMRWGRETLGLERIVAITDRENAPSIALLHKLGFELEKDIQEPGDEKALHLFAWQA